MNSDDIRKLVLRLFGLKSLEEATRDNWPWWTGYGEDSFGSITEGPFFPAFSMCPASSVQLAEQIDEIELSYDTDDKIWRCAIPKQGNMKKRFPDMRHHAYGDDAQIGQSVLNALKDADR